MGLLAGMPGVAKAAVVDLDFVVTGLSFTSTPTGVPPQSVAGTVTVDSLDVNGSPYSGSVSGSLSFSGKTISPSFPNIGFYSFSTASDGITFDADVGGYTVSFTGGLTTAGQVTINSPTGYNNAEGFFTGTLTIPDPLAAQWDVGPSSTSPGSFYSYAVTSGASGGHVAFDVNSVPEPSALLLLVPGLGLIGIKKRSRDSLKNTA
jgi:hypothetical protein